MSENGKINSLFSQEEDLFGNFLSEGLFPEFRKSAYDLWKKCSPPTTRDEYWKYTRLAPLLSKTYQPYAGDMESENSVPLKSDTYNLIFINGIFSVSDSDTENTENLYISDLNSAKKEKTELVRKLLENDKLNSDYFSLLNSAFHQNGPFIWVNDNTEVKKPIRLLHIITEKDRLVNIKGYVLTGANSRVKIQETWNHRDSEDNLVNNRLDYFIGINSKTEVVRTQTIGNSNHLISQEFAEQMNDSTLTISTLSMESKMIRNNLNVSLKGRGAECFLNGLYMLRDEEFIDNHTQIKHEVPGCHSDELYKGLLNDNSKGVFNGKVIVQRDAQKTNAFQYNGNILLSNNAQIYSKPELEIYADDVKCSHGSTTGQLDEEALFYLQSRGISKENSQNLLIRAFALEVLDRLGQEEIKEKIDSFISERYHLNLYD